MPRSAAIRSRPPLRRTIILNAKSASARTNIAPFGAMRPPRRRARRRRNAAARFFIYPPPPPPPTYPRRARALMCTATCDLQTNRSLGHSICRADNSRPIPRTISMYRPRDWSTRAFSRSPLISIRCCCCFFFIDVQ